LSGCGGLQHIYTRCCCCCWCCCCQAPAVVFMYCSSYVTCALLIMTIHHCTYLLYPARISYKLHAQPSLFTQPFSYIWSLGGTSTATQCMQTGVKGVDVDLSWEATLSLLSFDVGSGVWQIERALWTLLSAR
jgi:hypothetical protein